MAVLNEGTWRQSQGAALVDCVSTNISEGGNSVSESSWAMLMDSSLVSFLDIGSASLVVR